MKNVLKLHKLFFLLLFSISIISCDNDDNDDQTEQVVKTIVEIAAQEPDLSILVEALTAADGDLTALQGDGPFTVFAPTNDAFAKISFS